jgi:type II secretory pathway pseudopilin PulG
MLDVHPPDRPVHSLRDFFIHIATIVIGLIIAVGLEQAVESIHQHNEVAETRRALAEERELNRETFRSNSENYLNIAAIFQNNLRVFEYLRQHPGTPQAKLPGVVLFPPNVFEPATSAWTTAGETSVLSLMPRKEVTKNAETYFELNRALDGYNALVLAVARAAAYTAQTSDPSTLSPERVVQEIDLLEQANALHMLYGLWLQAVNRKQPDFVPGLTNQQVFAFSGMSNARALKEEFPEAFAFTQSDLDSADSMRRIK